MECRRLEPEYFSKAGGSSHFPQVTLHLLRLHRHASWPPPSEKTTLKDFHPSYVLFFRNPVYQTTDAIRGRGCSGEVDHPVGYRSGLHIWSVSWPLASRGTHPVVGVATSSCPLTEPGYRRLVGSNSSSWGWCLKTLKVYHDSRKYRHGVSYPRDVDEKLRVPETFYMLLDMDRGTLAFQVILKHNDISRKDFFYC